MKMGGLKAAAEILTRVSDPDREEINRRRLEKACRDFEAIFLQEILKGLRKTVPAATSRPEAIYRGLWEGEIARVCAGRGLGLADLLFSRLWPGDGVEERRFRTEAGAKGLREMADLTSESIRQGEKG